MRENQEDLWKILGLMTIFKIVIHHNFSCSDNTLQEKVKPELVKGISTLNILLLPILFHGGTNV